jgi:predicted transport protein
MYLFCKYMFLIIQFKDELYLVCIKVSTDCKDLWLHLGLSVKKTFNNTSKHKTNAGRLSVELQILTLTSNKEKNPPAIRP